MQGIVMQLDFALLSGQCWPSPILGLLGALAQQPGTAAGIGATARAHQLCIPLAWLRLWCEGDGRSPLALSPPRAVGGLGDLTLASSLCSPNQGKKVSGSRVADHRGFVLPGLSASLSSWLLSS